MADTSNSLARPPLAGGLRLHGLRSLQFKGSLLIVLLVLLVSLSMMAISLYATREALMERESQRAQEWASSLALSSADEVAQRNREALQRAANKIVQMQGVASVVFADLSGQVLASAEARAGLPSLVCTAEGGRKGRLTSECLNNPQVHRMGPDGMTYVDVTVPVRSSSSVSSLRPAGSPARIVGYLRFATDITEARGRLVGMAWAS